MWSGNVQRIDDNKLPDNIKSSPQETKIGRPRGFCIANIREVLKDWDFQEDQCRIEQLGDWRFKKMLKHREPDKCIDS